MLWEVVNASDNRDEGSKAGMGRNTKRGVFKKGDELQMDRTNGVTAYGKWDELQLWGSKLSLTAFNLKIIFKYLTSTMKSKT